MQNLQDLYTEQLRDIYDAEKQLVKALPKMAHAATSSDLKLAFENHLDQTRQHVERIEQIFQSMGVKAQGKTCKAMRGLVEEGSEAIEQESNADVKDAALIAAAQRVEHYEIAAYGTLCTYAKQLSHQDARGLLEETLREEKDADSKLTSIATSSVNKKARVS